MLPPVSRKPRHSTRLLGRANLPSVSDATETMDSVRQRREERLSRQIVQVGDAIGAFIEYWGFKSIHGRVWTLLALHDGPMAQSEIARALDVSRSLISGAVSELTDRGLLRPVGDHRNAPYEAVNDIWPTISNVLRSREWMLIESIRMTLEAALEELEYAESVGHPLRWKTDRVRMLLAMTELAQNLLRMLMSVRLPQTTDRFGAWFKKATTLANRLRSMV